MANKRYDEEPYLTAPLIDSDMLVFSRSPYGLGAPFQHGFMSDIADYIDSKGAFENIYNTDGALTANRTLTGNNFNLDFTGLNQFDIDFTNSSQWKMDGVDNSGALTFEIFARNQGNTSASDAVFQLTVLGNGVDSYGYFVPYTDYVAFQYVKNFTLGDTTSDDQQIFKVNKFNQYNTPDPVFLALEYTNEGFGLQVPMFYFNQNKTGILPIVSDQICEVVMITTSPTDIALSAVGYNPDGVTSTTQTQGFVNLYSATDGNAILGYIQGSATTQVPAVTMVRNIGDINVVDSIALGTLAPVGTTGGAIPDAYLLGKDIYIQNTGNLYSNLGGFTVWNSSNVILDPNASNTFFIQGNDSSPVYFEVNVTNAQGEGNVFLHPQSYIILNPGLGTQLISGNLTATIENFNIQSAGDSILSLIADDIADKTLLVSATNASGAANITINAQDTLTLDAAALILNNWNFTTDTLSNPSVAFTLLNNANDAGDTLMTIQAQNTGTGTADMLIKADGSIVLEGGIGENLILNNDTFVNGALSFDQTYCQLAYPTPQPDVGAGTGATFAVSGTQEAFLLQVTVGTFPAANDVIVDMYYAQTYAGNTIVTLTPANKETIQLPPTQQPFVPSVGGADQDSFVILSNDVPLATGITYAWWVRVTSA